MTDKMTSLVNDLGEELRESAEVREYLAARDAYAADRAISGVSGQMAVVLRDSDEPYRVHYSTVDIAEVANLEKKVPDNWINAGGNDVTEEMLSYLRPLVRGEVSVLMNNGVPVHLNLYSEGK